MPKSIAFIICVNDETYFEECLFYIERLRLPGDFTAEVYPVRNARSIYQGYNLAMQHSSAKYKVYMHQDVFLIDPDILLKFLGFFEQHPEAGMAGVLGADALSLDRRFYRSWNQGNIIGCSEKKAFHNCLTKESFRAAALDGMFLMTAKDLSWREDVLSGWDFYDISQSLEHTKAGGELWVLAGQQPWCIHDCGYLCLTGYDRAQETFLEVYGADVPDYTGQPPVYQEQYRQRFALMMELKEQWKALMFLDKIQEVREVLEKTFDERFVDTEIVVLKNILEILQKEAAEGIYGEEGFLYGCHSFAEAQQKYLKTKFYLRRMRYAPDDAGIRPEVSAVAERVICCHTML